jgi:two-component system response regulator LytT
MDQTYKVSEALVVLEKKLPITKFLRVHRSFIVNIDHIVEIEPWFNSTYNLIMKNDSKVPVSRTYVKEMKQMLGF